MLFVVYNCKDDIFCGISKNYALNSAKFSSKKGALYAKYHSALSFSNVLTTFSARLKAILFLW
jgi:hypothetical protein